jgi:SAM-dependent methyltransferase
LPEYVPPEKIFSEYAYFSSFSQAWLAHARAYAEMAIARFGLGPKSLVIEIASNDGYLLRNFVERGVPCLGVEPAANVAEAARKVGVETLVRFFGRDVGAELVAEGREADLVIGNNVLAQVPDLNNFVAGLRIVMRPEGVLTLEFPHLLRVFDVEELWTHGGSLRLYVCRQEALREEQPAVGRLRAVEHEAGLTEAATYAAFDGRVMRTKWALLDLLIRLKREGARIAGYGAPGKGNTLLNYCGIRTDFLDFTVDRNPYKHGRFLPGSRIPVLPVERLDEMRPDYVFILPWNLKNEIMQQLSCIRGWGGRFIVPIPEPEVLG